ncbi:MAG: nucleoside-diphosphate kinase [Gammaproteobacteria bacterium]|nr:nucleoside-diphosphate kinase [Gammaproteobacteria bacterium]
MATERTLSIVKPSAVCHNHIGGVLAKLEAAGLRIIAAKMLKLTPEQAGNFYDVHRARPFFRELVDFMTSGPVLVQVLEGEDAIAKNREVMGATDPAKAAPGTIRAEFGKDISENAVHGSDAPETAAVEIAFFFAGSELCPR